MEKYTAISDTGFVVAIVNQSDIRHHESVSVYRQQKHILLPQTVLAEVCYLIGRDAGTKTVISFLQGISSSRFTLVSLNEEDIKRVIEILRDYQDSRIDFVDATVMAIAERFKINRVLTLDRRDFLLFRPSHCNSFELLP